MTIILSIHVYFYTLLLMQYHFIYQFRMWQGETKEGEQTGDKRIVYIFHKDPHSELIIMNPVEERTFYMAVDHDQPRANNDLT